MSRVEECPNLSRFLARAVSAQELQVRPLARGISGLSHVGVSLEGDA